MELALERLVVAAKGGDDIGPYRMEAEQAGATAAEIQRALRRVFGGRLPPEASAP